MLSRTIKCLTGLVAGLSFLFGASAQATGFQSEPVELLVDFKIEGNVSGFGPAGITYTIGGPGFAPWYIFRSGEIIDLTLPWREVAQLSDAEIVFPPFDPASPPGVLEFTCKPGSCTLEIGGSVLQSDAGVPLAGRAPFIWGPVINSPDFDPSPVGAAPIRILGCGGLIETSGHGKYANMVGSICFNGALNFANSFDILNPPPLSGGSKCTITLHTPAPGFPMIP